MADDKIALYIIVGAVALIVLINYSLFRQFLGRKDNTWSNLINTARDPWKKENDEISELSRLVSGFKQKTPPEDGKEDPTGGQ